MVLSSKHLIEISIKPDMTYDEWMTEMLLLKERRKLIDQGVECKYIRLQGNSLYKQKVMALFKTLYFAMFPNYKALTISPAWILQLIQMLNLLRCQLRHPII